MRCQSQLTEGSLRIFVFEHDEALTGIDVTWLEPDEPKSRVFLEAEIEHDDQANEDYITIQNWHGEEAAQVLMVIVRYDKMNLNFDTSNYPNDSRQDLTPQSQSTAQGNLHCQPGDQDCTLQLPTDGSA